MNVRKSIDYSTMFAALDAAMRAGISQMKLYCELGRIVCTRPEKGAAVAAAEHLNRCFPDASGLSPRNLRRMRDFCRMYDGNPELLALAMEIGWTQNVVIMEADLSMEERSWYLRAVMRFGWTKAELQRKIELAAHLEPKLNKQKLQISPKFKSDKLACRMYDQGVLSCFGQYLRELNGRIYHKGSGEEIQLRMGTLWLSRDWLCGNWQSELPISQSQDVWIGNRPFKQKARQRLYSDYEKNHFRFLHGIGSLRWQMWQNEADREVARNKMIILRLLDCFLSFGFKKYLQPIPAHDII